MANKTQNDMTTKELAWEEYGRQAYEAEMELRFMMDTWPDETESVEDARKNQGVEV